MSWPDALVKVFTDYQFLFFASVFVYLVSGLIKFMLRPENVTVETETVEVEVISSDLIETMEEVIGEMRQAAGASANPGFLSRIGPSLIDWAKTIEEAIEVEDE